MKPSLRKTNTIFSLSFVGPASFLYREAEKGKRLEEGGMNRTR